MLELLKDATYIRYWLAVVVSFLGDAMTKVTLIYVVATLTDSPVMISLVVLAQLLPSGVLGAFIGPLADRLSKRSLLVGADIARIVVVLAMIPVLDSAWALIGLVLLEGVGKAVFETARIAAVPRIVGRPDRIPAAVALFQSTNWTVYLVGPAVGGVLIGLGDVSAVLAIDAATFLVSALLLGSMTLLGEVPEAPAGGERYWASMASGLRGVLEVPSLRVLFAVAVPVMIVFGLFTTNFNAQLLTEFDLSGFEFGLAQALLAGGSVGGALLGPALIKRYQAPNGLLLASVGLFGVALVALAPTLWLWAALGLAVVAAWCLLAGFSSGLYQVPIANTLLNDMPEHLRGRGVGLLNTVTVNATLVGVALGGLVASMVGVASSIIVAGAALVLFIAACIAPASARARRATSAGEASDPVAVGDPTEAVP
jgi:MFS family permease